MSTYFVGETGAIYISAVVAVDLNPSAMTSTMRRTRMRNSTKLMKQLFASSVPPLILLALGLRCAQAEEESEINHEGDNAASFSCAIFAFFMWLVPTLSIEIGYYRLSLFNSAIWNPHKSTKAIIQEVEEEAGAGDEFYTKSPVKPSSDDENRSRSGTDENNVDNEEEEKVKEEPEQHKNAEARVHVNPKLRQGLKTLVRTAGFTILFWLVLITVTAIGIGLGTRALDERMVLILQGWSRISAGIVLSVISFRMLVWTGIYFATYNDLQRNVGKGSTRELSFNIRWSLHRPLSTVFFLSLPFFEGVNPATIPLSMIGGAAAGFFTDAMVTCSRRLKIRCRRNVCIGICTALLGFSGAILMSDGAWYIATVWLEDDFEAQDSILGVIFIVWVVFLFVIHMVLLWHTRKSRRAEAQGSQGSSSLSNTDPMSIGRPRMATSLIRDKLKGSVTSNAHDMEGGGGWESRPSVDGENNLEQTAAYEAGLPEVSERIEQDQQECVEDQNGIDVYYGDVYDGDDGRPCYRDMFYEFKCCGCVRGSDKTCGEKIWLFICWSVWIILVLGSLFIVAVNLGSTYQQEAARVKLPYVFDALYRNINDGPVCAFDDRGPNSNITTFPNKEAAHAEGFLVVHCGACAACSDWHNLRLEYTTRHYLAQESQRCAKKSLFGAADSVTRCLEQPPVGFQGQCAVCWTEDILCTKKYCSLIYIQSLIINTMANFQVGPDTITSATCEEAHCEAGNPGDFVYCSGATRRRMNVTSSIDRPGAQQCGIVDVDWEEIFPE